MKYLLVLLLASIPLLASAGCPSGYHRDGKYCVANNANSKPATPLYGNSCPSGWHRDSGYCVANTSSSKEVVPLVGNSCPSGWHRDGQFCVSNR